MSVEDGSNEAIADLGLSSKFHSRSIRLNNSRGAGVNATSKVDITFVTSQPLSELVWCPSKGVCVKNTYRGCSMTEKEAASVWGLRPNHMAVSSAKSISTKLNSLENIVNDKIDASSLCPAKFGVDEVDASRRVSRSMVMDGLIHSQDKVTKTAGSGPILGVAIANSGGLSAVPGNACSEVIRSQEVPSRQVRSLLNIPEDKAENTIKFELSAENYIMAEATKNANPEALQSRVSAENFHGNHRKLYLKKGKSKALSDGNVNDQISDDNMSHGSTGSCNSKMLVSCRNTKRSLDQQLMVTSKRLKQSTERDADSFIRQSSSFMSWISNMVKGYPGCNQDEAPASMLADVLTTRTEKENLCQKPVDNDLRDVGFRNLFQSIWCSNDSVKGRKIYLDYRSSEASGYVQKSSMVDVSAVPLTAYKTSDVIPQDNDQSHKICDQGVESPLKQGMILSSSFSTKEIKILPRTKNTDSSNSAKCKEVGKSSQSISSTDKERAHATEYCEEKEAQPFCPKRDYLGSLWITRFHPKNSQPASNSIKSDLSVNKRDLPSSEIILSPGPVTSHVKGCNEGLIGSEQVNVKDEQNLEVMASVFARRLNALKQVIPFDATCKTSSMDSACLFCGVKGHDIQACSEITGSEIEELIHVVKSYDKFKDSTRLCIKCFQLSHWATECWQGSSIKHSARQGKSGGNRKPDAETGQLQMFSKLNQDIADARNPLGHVSCTQEVGESSSRPQNTIPATMEDYFDAVKRLRLSRSDFLRLIDSQISPSHLKGYYLRIRLRNRKEGLCEKGYYVACIQNTATNRGALCQASVGVTIGSFTCLVESRYISNQEYVEDELMTWWTETAKCGHGQNPSLDELEHKYHERLKQGF